MKTNFYLPLLCKTPSHKNWTVIRPELPRQRGKYIWSHIFDIIANLKQVEYTKWGPIIASVDSEEDSAAIRASLRAIAQRLRGCCMNNLKRNHHFKRGFSVVAGGGLKKYLNRVWVKPTVGPQGCIAPQWPHSSHTGPWGREPWDYWLGLCTPCCGLMGLQHLVWYLTGFDEGEGADRIS